MRRRVCRYGWSCGLLVGLFELALFLAHRRHADIRRAEHQADAHADKVNPFPLLDRQALGEQPHLEEPDEVERRDDDQQPAGALLPVVEKPHNLPPRCSATLTRSLSPRPDRLTTIR